MHDLLEGIVQYELNLFFSIPMNTTDHKHGHTALRKKGFRNVSSNKQLGLNASVCVLCTTTTTFFFTDEMICYVKYLISDHHNIFKCLYHDRKLIPKNHFMINFS